MDLKSSKAAFLSLLSNISRDVTTDFLSWVRDSAAEQLNDKDNTDIIMGEIQADIRSSLPLDALLPSEKFQDPCGQNRDLNPETTVHVDGFLYDDDAVDELCDEGKMSRNYCTQCGCRSVSPLTFLSHSMTVKQLKFIFRYLLPDLNAKAVLDVGSRTGAVLYGAHFYSGASSIFGVEINEDFCKLQENVIEKYNMQARIKVIHSDIRNQAEILHQADVTIMNNVFEFFVDPQSQINIWKFLRQTLKSNSLLVSCPSVADSLVHLGISEMIPEWLEECNTQDQRRSAYSVFFADEENVDDFDSIYLYRVK